VKHQVFQLLAVLCMSAARVFSLWALLFTKCTVFVVVQSYAFLLGCAAPCADFAGLFSFGRFALFHGFSFVS
jgi:hypothetical protein